ncbi:hypothetical protein J3R82DRAFT_1936 [Butyriboletus roseoflavus]|nr:hypothetical protein J3R82DRAFT_1936 [Butyriboletus roseoflavus]
MSTDLCFLVPYPHSLCLLDLNTGCSLLHPRTICTMPAVSGRAANVLLDLDDDEPVVIRAHLATVETQNDEVRIAEANRSCKSTKASVPEVLSTFNTEIQTLTKKFRVLVEMFPPLKDILSHPLTPSVSNMSPASLEIVGKACYASSFAEEAAIVAELDLILPPHIQNLQMSHHFADQLATHVSTGRSSELHKLRQAANNLFQLPSGNHYFSYNTASHCLEFPKIHVLLGIPQDATKPKYPTFPPLLYTDHKVNAHTPFSNWELLTSILCIVFWGWTALTHDVTRCPGGKSNGTIWGVTCYTPECLAWATVMAVFLVSPDSQFPKDGVGANSEIQYHKLFFQYKCLFVNSWDTLYVLDLVSKVNQRVFGKTKAHALGTATINEDFTANIDAAMATMAMALPDSDSLPVVPHSEFQNSDLLESALSSLSSAMAEIVSSNDIAGTEQASVVLLQVPNSQAGEVAFSLEMSEEVLDNPEESVSARGRGRAHGTNKGNKAAANGAVVRRTCRSAAK